MTEGELTVKELPNQLITKIIIKYGMIHFFTLSMRSARGGIFCRIPHDKQYYWFKIVWYLIYFFHLLGIKVHNPCGTQSNIRCG